MKIVEAKVYIVETTGLRPVIVELLTDEGISGIGEAAVGFGTGYSAAAAMICELAENFVIGKEAARISDIWNDFYYLTFWGKGGGAILFAAASAIEQALWDIKGKVLGVPIYELLGGQQHDSIRVYANGWSTTGFATPEELAEKALKVVTAGYDAIKMYPLSKKHPTRNTNLHIKNRIITKEDYQRSVAAVQCVRSAIGQDITLMVDVSSGGSPDIMTKLGQDLESYDLYWYEEPIDTVTLEAYPPLKEKVNIPIAAGERLYTRYGFRRAFELQAFDIVQPDPGTCGGIMEAFKIGAMAEAYQLRFAPHNCGGSVLTAAALQVAICSSNFDILETYPLRDDIYYDILENPLEKCIKNGRLEIPKTPGLGVTLNHQIIDQFLVYKVR